MVSKPNEHNGPQPAGTINYLNVTFIFIFIDVFLTGKKP